MRPKTPNPIPLERVHMTNPPRPLGRPVTGQAKPAKVRMKEMRQRTLSLVRETNDPLESMPVSGLLEALRVGYRDGQIWEVAAIFDALLARMAEAPSATVRIKAEFTEY